MNSSGKTIGGLLLIAAAMVGGGIMQHHSNEATPAVIAAEPASSVKCECDNCKCQAAEIVALKSKLAEWEEYGRKMEAYLGRKPTAAKPKQTAKVTYQNGGCANGQCSRAGLFGRRR